MTKALYQVVLVLALIFGSVNITLVLCENVEVWLTTADKSVLLQQQQVIVFSFSAFCLCSYTPFFKITAGLTPDFTIVVDTNTSTSRQDMVGFGFTLTCGSASLIYGLPDDQRAQLIQELFGEPDDTNATGIGISFLRLNLGACDMCEAPYTYDDMDYGETDTDLEYFSIACENSSFVPLLQEILEVYPTMKLLATPWSAPVWMKDKNSFIGGSLLRRYYSVYANYFVKCVEREFFSYLNSSGTCPQWLTKEL